MLLFTPETKPTFKETTKLLLESPAMSSRRADPGAKRQCLHEPEAEPAHGPMDTVVGRIQALPDDVQEIIFRRYRLAQKVKRDVKAYTGAGNSQSWSPETTTLVEDLITGPDVFDMVWSQLEKKRYRKALVGAVAKVAGERGLIGVLAKLNLVYPNMWEYWPSILLVAAEHNQSRLVRWIFQNHLRTDQYGSLDTLAEWAAANGNTELLEWLVSQERPSDDDEFELPDGTEAARNGHLEVLWWLHERKAVLEPDELLTEAAAGGHVRVVDWILKTWSVAPTSAAANAAAQRGHVSVLNVLATRSPRWLPDISIDTMCAKGDWEGLAWMLHRNPALRPSNHFLMGPGMIHGEGVLFYLRQLAQENIWPDESAANLAIAENRLGILEFLSEHGIYPKRGRTLCLKVYQNPAAWDIIKHHEHSM